MIFGKMWRAVRAQMNKLANWFSGVDPIAQLQYEYDQAVEQLKSGREGLAQYRALVERVTRQAERDRQHVNDLEAKIKYFLQAGQRDAASKFALEYQKAKTALAENERQLALHEQAYNNHLTKIKHAANKLNDLQEKIHHYDAELKMSRAEAEVAELAKTFNFDITTDFGQVEKVIEDRISLNRAKVRVSADLSEEGMDQIRHEQDMEKALAEQALDQFEQELGSKTRATTEVGTTSGPAPKSLP
jgi:phage shock protein A